MSVAQLAAEGVNRTAIKVRMRTGRLHRLHRGVYAVGHRVLTLDARFMAAVLACAPRGHLSHRAAAACWGFMAWDDAFPIDVTVPWSGPRSRPGLRVHRTRLTDSRDFVHHKGIPITTVERALLDLAEGLPDKGLRRAVRRSQALYLTNVRLIADVLTRAGGRRGASRLAALIADGPAPTRSDLEDIVLGLIIDAGLRRPEINARLDGVFPDLRWPDLRLTLECDGARWHEGRLAHEDDAERQARLEADGERFLRVSWQQALFRPNQTIARLVAAGVPRA